MNDHVGKPFDLNTLVQLLRVQAGWPPIAVASDPPEVSLPAQVRQSAEAAKVDIEAALHRLGGNQSMYQKLLRTFVGDLRAMPAQLDGHLEQKQVKEAGRLLHTLKGLAATMGVSLLAEQAATGEKMMTIAVTPADFRIAAERVRAAIDAALPGLDALLSTLQLGPKPGGLIAEPGGEPPAASALQAALQALALHLKNSDMAAIQAMADVQHRFGSLVGQQLGPLQSAVDNLDFASALPLCEALMTPNAT
jgi:HPt (histidine-containing phosphotransfer) domain-containing protein